MSEGLQHKNSDFRDSTLTFYSDKITTYLFPEEVMMDWEDNIMGKHANVVCHNNGDVLEIGFGMGISADYIQSLNPNSHTIIEIHPQIYSNLETWAAGKTGVTIINADWKDIEDTLSQYDGIFYDGIYDVNINDFMKNFVPNHIKSGGKLTYFNSYYSAGNDIYDIGATFVTYSVIATTNSYYSGDVYYLPTVTY